MKKAVNKLFIKQLLFSLTTSLFVSSYAINSYATRVSSSAGFQSALRSFYDSMGVYMNVFLGFVILQNILIFIYHLIRLGGVSTNPEKRAKCIQDILISGVCLALIGGATTVVYLIIAIGV